MNNHLVQNFTVHSKEHKNLQKEEKHMWAAILAAAKALGSAAVAWAIANKDVLIAMGISKAIDYLISLFG